MKSSKTGLKNGGESPPEASALRGAAITQLEPTKVAQQSSPQRSAPPPPNSLPRPPPHRLVDHLPLALLLQRRRPAELRRLVR